MGIFNKPTAKVIMMIGDSNMDGREATSNLEALYQGPQTNEVDVFFKTTRTSANDGAWAAIDESIKNNTSVLWTASNPTLPKFGMQMYIGKDRFDSLGDKQFLINASEGGSRTSYWVEGATEQNFEEMGYYWEQGIVQLIHSGYKVELAGVLIVLGYNDVAGQEQATFAANLDTLCDDLLAYYDDFFAAIQTWETLVLQSPDYTNHIQGEPNITNLGIVQAAQLALSKDRTQVILKDVLATYIDGIHSDGSTIKRMSDSFKDVI